MSKRPDYGIDAPGLATGFLAGGIGAFALALLIWEFWRGSLLVGILTAILAFGGLYLSGMGCLMVVWSKHIKLKTRETMLDYVIWRGNEQVLDVGCGRGLMMVGAAKRLTSGKATGIDIWQAKDQSGNGPKGALENAVLEGVSDRVHIETGDMRALPFANGSFEVVMSHWAVHNLEQVDDRATALREMMRVLRPGGSLILADIEHREAYMAALKNMGVAECRLDVKPVMDKILGIVSFDSFRPSTIFARKALLH